MSEMSLKAFEVAGSWVIERTYAGALWYQFFKTSEHKDELGLLGLLKYH